MQRNAYFGKLLKYIVHPILSLFYYDSKVYINTFLQSLTNSTRGGLVLIHGYHGCPECRSWDNSDDVVPGFHGSILN